MNKLGVLSKLTFDYFRLSLSFLYLQVVHPHLPLGQLDSSVGEGGTDQWHRSLFAVSVRHAGPQQLSLNLAPITLSGLSDPDWTRVVMNQKPTPDNASATWKTTEDLDWSDVLNNSWKQVPGRFHNRCDIR